MNAVENYLIEVSSHLPASARDDIIDELRAAIEEQLHEAAAAHGGAPDEADAEAVLRRFGHPRRIAADYLPRRYLIGPALYPVFARALTAAVVLVLALQVVILLVAAATSDYSLAPMATFKGLLETALLVTASVVVIFAILERSGEHVGDDEDWQPGKLHGARATLIDRGDVATNLITEAVFLLWWNGALVFDSWPPFVGEALQFGLSDAWAPWFWPLNVIVGAAFVLHLFVLLRGLWRRPTLVLELLLSVAALAIGLKMLSSGNLIAIEGALAPDLGAHLQNTVRIALGVVLAFIGWDIYLAARGLAELSSDSEGLLAAGNPGGDRGA